MIACEIGRRQPWAFDGGGGRRNHKVEKKDEDSNPKTQRRQQQHRGSSVRHRRSGFGFPLIWIVLINALQLQTRIAEAKIGYFWHITDLHFDSHYSTKGDTMRSCWNWEHSQSNQARPGRFGDYSCDSPWALIESAMHTMKSRQGDNVEFVLWTGDGLSHSSRKMSEDQRHNLLRNITELLRRTFPSQFVFPVLGHEDGSPSNFRQLVDLWQTWLPSEALQTFERGGYYTIEQRKSRLRIIMLNTNFMRHGGRYAQSHSAAVRQRGSGTSVSGSSSEQLPSSYYYHHGNYYHSNGNNNNNGGGYHERTVYGMDRNGGGVVGANGAHVSALSGADSHESERQWMWLEEVLAKSNLNKETVYIVGHIPPGSDERDHTANLNNGHQFFSQKNNHRYLELVRKYSSIIQGQFFGHLHSDSFRIVYNDKGKPVSWMMMAPSVTPRKVNVGSNNPGLRLYKFETDSGQVLDYSQFYLNLTSANEGPEAIWQPEYNLTSHYYGLSEVSAVALHNLADRFTNSDDPLFAKYLRANVVRYNPKVCDSSCALNHYCAITRLDYHEYRQCLKTDASPLSSNGGVSIHRTTGIMMRSFGKSNSIRGFAEGGIWWSTLAELVLRLLPILMAVKSCRGRVIDWHRAGARNVVCLISAALRGPQNLWRRRRITVSSAKLLAFRVSTDAGSEGGARGGATGVAAEEEGEIETDGRVVEVGTKGVESRKLRNSSAGIGEGGLYAKTTYLGKVFCFVSVTVLLLYSSCCCYLLVRKSYSRSSSSGGFPSPLPSSSSPASSSSSAKSCNVSSSHAVNGEHLQLLDAMNFGRILRGCHKEEKMEEHRRLWNGSVQAATKVVVVSSAVPLTTMTLVTSLVLVSCVSTIMVIQFCSHRRSCRNKRIMTWTLAKNEKKNNQEMEMVSRIMLPGGGGEMTRQKEEMDRCRPFLLICMQICQDFIIKTLIKMTER